MIVEVTAEIQISHLSNTNQYCYRWNGLRSWKSRRARNTARSGPLIRPRTEWTGVAVALHIEYAWLETRDGSSDIRRSCAGFLQTNAGSMLDTAVPSKSFPIYHATLYCRNYWHPRKTTYKRLENKAIAFIDAICLRRPQFSMPPNATSLAISSASSYHSFHPRTLIHVTARSLLVFIFASRRFCDLDGEGLHELL
jgi:hypothetical protein